MKAAFGIMYMVLVANLSVLSGLLPCASRDGSAQAMAHMSMPGMPSTGMADMGHPKDAGKPCDMPVMPTCCQSLPSCTVEIAGSALTRVAANKPVAPMLAEMSRSIAPETPPPKA